MSIESVMIDTECQRINRTGNWRHGLSHTKLYSVWVSMIGRCHRISDKSFGSYGGRGISVCERWRTSFLAFRDDMGPKPTARHSIERVDNNGDYCPNNCKWATSSEQNANRRTIPRDKISHCRRGHEFTKENTVPQSGTRTCRICKTNGVRARRAHKLEQAKGARQ